MPRYQLTPETLLRLDMAEEDAVRRTLPSFRVKGMFISPLARMLGDDWELAMKELSAPPRIGRYLPFTDYPQSDLVRLSYRLGRREYPNLGAFETFRRFAQRDFDTFAGTTLGRIVLTTVSDPVLALLRFPDVYSKVAPGPWKISVKQPGPHHIALRIENHPGIWGSQVGQLEAIVGSFGVRPEVTVQVDETDAGQTNVSFDVHCT